MNGRDKTGRDKTRRGMGPGIAVTDLSLALGGLAQPLTE